MNIPVKNKKELIERILANQDKIKTFGVIKLGHYVFFLTLICSGLISCKSSIDLVTRRYNKGIYLNICERKLTNQNKFGSTLVNKQDYLTLLRSYPGLDKSINKLPQTAGSTSIKSSQISGHLLSSLNDKSLAIIPKTNMFDAGNIAKTANEKTDLNLFSTKGEQDQASARLSPNKTKQEIEPFTKLSAIAYIGAIIIFAAGLFLYQYLAILDIILGILFYMLVLAGVLFGITSLVHIKKDPNKYRGKLLAKFEALLLPIVAGIGIVGMLGFLMLASFGGIH